ncbi:nucleotidyltransferase family protein [Gloeobacter violaceus]|uniref:Mannose-1-phosphate guanyltransferase n=1 Tax=Gloeobacter violaceus (strain ATCC 29082 / PCC 7421) TaxID=251221 RepID=Q7NII3_GLOVI|nr:NDP-sugar synthase [Gloeobacter violaceus]BAC90141.1 mannose-1-phosphate guanyltransferase [Gloeobacter violaceus PCC 7421]
MKAFILAAGKGTRLRPLTNLVPKPLVPVLNRPVMGRMLDLCREHGFCEAMANLHYQGEKIERAFGSGYEYGVDLAYSHETQLLGTAGGVRRQAAYLQGGTFVVTSADVVTDLDFSELLAFHRTRGALATIATTVVSDPSRFGVLVCDPDGRVRSFQEKPAPGTARSNLVNMGIYMLEPEIFDFIPAAEEFDFGSQLFPMLVAKGAPIYALETKAYWSDIGTLSQYLHTHWDLLSQPGLQSRIGRHTVIEPGARISPTALVGDHCYIHSTAIIEGNSCIGDGTILNHGARVLDSVVWSAAAFRLSVADTVVRSVRADDCCIAIS